MKTISIEIALTRKPIFTHFNLKDYDAPERISKEINCAVYLAVKLIISNITFSLIHS